MASSNNDAMEGVVETNANDAAIDAERRAIIDGLAKLNVAAASFMSGSTFDRDEDFYNNDLFQTAMMTNDALTDMLHKAIVAKVPRSDLPPNIHMHIGKLGEYIDKTKEALRKVVADTSDEKDKNDMLKRIDNPMAQRPYLAQVMATGNEKLVSMRMAEARMEAEQRFEALKVEHSKLSERLTMLEQGGSGVEKRARDDDTTDAPDSKRLATEKSGVTISAGATTARPSIDDLSNFWRNHATQMDQNSGSALPPERRDDYSDSLARVMSRIKTFQSAVNIHANGPVEMGD